MDHSSRRPQPSSAGRTSDGRGSTCTPPGNRSSRLANEPGALLYRATDLFSPSLIHEALRASGIPVVSTGGNVMVNKGMPAAPYYLEIWVPADRLAEAAKIVEESRAPEPSTTTPWTSLSCSAANEPGFNLCWSCGAKRNSG